MFNFKELLGDVFKEDSHEYSVIELSYQIIAGTIPSTPAEMKNQMIQLDQQRTELSTLYYLINRKIMYLREDLQKESDATYVRLVKLGRPSKDAIETELRATNSVYAVNSLKIAQFENVKELVLSYIRSIDSRKQTVIELLRNAYRVD